MTFDDVLPTIEPASALIALDFDGTLAPIVSDPDSARPVDGALELLVALAGFGAQVAVVTGRDAATALRLGGLDRIPRVVVSGLHGAQLWRAGELTSRAEPPAMAEVRSRLPDLVHVVDRDAWVEDKGLSLVVHTRPAAEPERTLEELRRPVGELAARHGLDVVGGKLVLEIRIPGLSKADALETLLTDGYRFALYAGDDQGDIPAFRYIDRWAAGFGRTGLTIAVGDAGEVREAAMIHVDSPADLIRTLGRVPH